MLTKNLYSSPEMKIAMDKEIHRAEEVLLNAKGSNTLYLSWETTNSDSDNDAEFYGIPVSVRKRVYDLTYGTTDEAKNFRSTLLYPELFKRDDEDDIPVEIFLSSKNFGMESINGKDGIVISFSSTYWWDGDYDNGMPFKLIDIRATNDIPQRANFFEPSKDESYPVSVYLDDDYVETTDASSEDEDEFVETDDDILAKMADIYCLAAMSGRRTAIAMA